MKAISKARPQLMSKLVNVAKYLPWMKRVCSRYLILDQLEELKDDIKNMTEPRIGAPVDEIFNRIDQIKKDITNS